RTRHGRLDAASIGCRAQCEDAIEITSLHRRAARDRSGCQDELVESDRFTIHDAGAGRDVDPLHTPAGAVVDRVVDVDRFAAKRLETVFGSFEKRLRERWPVIGILRLVPDQYNLAFIAFLTQRDGKLRSAMPGPDDDDARHHE